jgi:hypothetical protein
VLNDYVRTRAAQVYLEPRDGARSLGRQTVVAGNGRSVTVDLAVLPAETVDFAGRKALAYAVTGHAADQEIGYEVEGRLVIDRETLAYLLIETIPRVVRTAR